MPLLAAVGTELPVVHPSFGCSTKSEAKESSSSKNACTAVLPLFTEQLPGPFHRQMPTLWIATV
jgi:hypothetical protein